MEIEFRQVTSDYYNAYRHISKRVCYSTKWRYLATLSGGIFGFSLAFGAISIAKFYEKYSFLPKDELDFGIGIILVGSMVLVIGLKVYNSKVRPLIFDSNGLFLSTQIYKIEDNHLFHDLGGTHHFYQWECVREVEQTSEYIFVFIDLGAALYIPRHGFSSDEQYNEFYNELKLHTQKNR